MRKITLQKIAKTGKGITKAVFLGIAELARIGIISFSRKSFFEKNVLAEYGHLPWQVASTLRRFENFGYLRKKTGGQWELSQRGRRQMTRYIVEDITAPPRPEQWDWKWRILVFDVPEEKKWARDLFRSKLQEWHFRQLQRSVYISPFDCGEEFENLLTLLNLNHYVHIMVAERIGPALERLFVSHFKMHKFFRDEK